MEIETVESWRELDEAIAEAAEQAAGRHVHPTLVFRGLARADRANVSRLSRLGEQHPRVERHLIRNFRKYAHREPPSLDERIVNQAAVLSVITDVRCQMSRYYAPSRIPGRTVAEGVSMEDRAPGGGVDGVNASERRVEPPRATG